MAPEVIEKTPYGKAADLWSLGAVIYDMLVGTPPFHVSCKDLSKKQKDCHRSNTNRSATKYNILHCNYKIPQHISEASNSLIRGLLKLDVEHRIGGYDANISEIQEHAFFEGVSWQKVETRDLRPPYVPTLDGPTDVSNFDEKHTEEKKGMGSVGKAQFDFRHPNALSDHHVHEFDYVYPILQPSVKTS